MGRKKKAEVTPPKPEPKPETVTEVKHEVKEEVKEVKFGDITVKPITWEEFDKFEPERVRKERKSVFKEIVKKAMSEPVRVTNLKRGQIMVLIKLAYDNGLDVKYDFKNGIVLLAPSRSQIS
jgi:hypothetical protein